MTSGIYQLTFVNGDTYIGKSINIENRWKQHREKLSTGKAASSMQVAYNTYGDFYGEILIECHPDHIDLAESCFIARVNPTLNSSRPPDPFPNIIGDDFDHVFQQLKFSTLEHINGILELSTNLEDLTSLTNLERDAAATCVELLEEQIELLKERIQLLLLKRTDEEINADIGLRIGSMEQQAAQLRKQYTRLELKNADLQKELDNKPWWKKLLKSKR